MEGANGRVVADESPPLPSGRSDSSVSSSIRGLSFGEGYETSPDGGGGAPAAGGVLEEEDDTPDWLQSAAAAVGVSPPERVSARPSMLPPTSVNAATAHVDSGDALVADDAAAATEQLGTCSPREMVAHALPASTTPSPPLPAAHRAARATPTTQAGIAAPPNHTTEPVAATPRPHSRSSSGRALAESELVRRARRRLAMIASGGGGGEVATPASRVASDGEEEPDDEEMLGRVYFLHTKLAGRRLLGAWSAWRA